MKNKQFMTIIICILLVALCIVSFGYIRKSSSLRKEMRRRIDLEGRIGLLERRLREKDKELKEAKEEAKRKDEEENKKYSDLYRVMADKCGLSIMDERKKAMIIPLGNAYDQETLKDVLSKLKLWSSKYYAVKDLNKLFVLKKEEGADNTYLMAQEFYIVIPKYKADEISLKELELFENGNLYPVPNDFIDGKSYTGPVLICQNISDIAPNGEICIESESGETKFSPFVSLKDGSLMLPDEIYNAAGILDMKDYDNNDYDEDLFNEIKEYFYYYE